MVRTRGAIFSCANWLTVERKSCSSSESRVSGEAGCDARTESATGIKLPLKCLPVQQARDDFHFWSLCSNWSNIGPGRRSCSRKLHYAYRGNFGAGTERSRGTLL